MKVGAIAFECGYSSFLGQNRTQFSVSFFLSLRLWIEVSGMGYWVLGL